MRNLLKELYVRVVVGKQKAIAAFVVAGVGAFLTKHGLTFHGTPVSYLQALAVAVAAHLSVYLKNNK